MIRMGRSNGATKPAPPPPPQTSNSDAQKTNQPFGSTSPTAENLSFRSFGENSSNRAFTESESMARDIKDGRISGFVGNGMTLTGETEFKTILRVDGHLVGKVTSEAGTLHVGSSGQVDAGIHVATAIIHGTVNGDIVVSERIELGRTAKITGNVSTPSLMMEQGAILEGHCNMVKPKADFDKRAAQSVVETVRAEKELAAKELAAAKAETNANGKAENTTIMPKTT